MRTGRGIAPAMVRDMPARRAGMVWAMAETTIVTVTVNPAVDRVLEAPQFEVGKHVNAQRVAMYPAGKGVIVSRVLSQLGERSIATGFVGRNELGVFEEFLERIGGGHAICQFLVVRGRTRDNITIVDPVNETETHLRDAGFTVQPEDVERLASKVGLLARRDAIVCFCGSLPPGLEAKVLAGIARRCRDQRARVVIDSSGESLRVLRGEDLWLVKLNAAELAEFSGMPTETEADVVAAATAISSRGDGGARNIIATRGPDGAVLVGEGGVAHARASVHPGRIISSVGSGDALLAGFLQELTRTGDWMSALKTGVAVATANAVNREAGLIEPADLNEFVASATAEPLALRK